MEKIYYADFNEPQEEPGHDAPDVAKDVVLMTGADASERVEKTVAAFDALAKVLKQSVPQVRRAATVAASQDSATESPMEEFAAAVDDLRALIDGR